MKGEKAGAGWELSHTKWQRVASGRAQHGVSWCHRLCYLWVQQSQQWVRPLGSRWKDQLTWHTSTALHWVMALPKEMVDTIDRKSETSIGRTCLGHWWKAWGCGNRKKRHGQEDAFGNLDQWSWGASVSLVEFELLLRFTLDSHSFLSLWSPLDSGLSFSICAFLCPSLPSGFC